MAKSPKLTNSALSPDQHVSVSVRKIANGFIASHSQTGPKGEYSSVEHFHPKRPKISVSGMTPPKMMGAPKPKKAKGLAPVNLAGMKL